MMMMKKIYIVNPLRQKQMTELTSCTIFRIVGLKDSEMLWNPPFIDNIEKSCTIHFVIHHISIKVITWDIYT